MSVNSTSQTTEPKHSKKKRKGHERPKDMEEPSGTDATDPLIDTEAIPTEEVEVLSHAAQRKAKKRKLKELLSTDETSETPASKPNRQADDKPSPPPRQNSVWVGNLSFKTTEAQLKEFFDGVGEITRVHMPKKQVIGQGKGMRGENRGFAYVDFATPEAQSLAIKLSEKNLDGRRLLIKSGDDFTGRPDAPKPAIQSDEDPSGASTGQKPPAIHSKTAQRILGAQKQPAGQTLFMGNLPFETKEEDIREMIEGHGLPTDLEEQAKQDGTAKTPGGKTLRWLKKIRMGTFEDSGLCKGWAFLDFLNTTYATAVLVNPRNHYLKGRKLVVEYGSPDAVRRGGGGPRPRKQYEEHDPEETKKERKRRKYDRNKERNKDRENQQKQEQKLVPKEDEKYVRARDGRLRPRPGAALALAKRETVAIVPSSGKKTVF